MPRKPIVSGQFYPDSFDRLENQIKECFLSKFGPGKLPQKQKKKTVTAAICPHAGYQFSGPAAAHVYREIAESQKPDLFVIIGPNHSNYGEDVSVWTEGKWETPFGLIEVDSAFAKQIIRNSESAKEDEYGHRYEHSIEVQLPFLQFIYGSDFRFVPVCLKRYDQGLAHAVFQTAQQLKKRICLIASSDFTHFGPAYGYVPFKSKIKENMYKLDRKAVSSIEKLDSDGFQKHLVQTSATICGSSPILTAIQFAKLMKKKKAKLLKYYTSGDITGDYSNAVAYAAIII